MNLIIMSDNHISSFSSCIEAEAHRHLAFQLFIRLDGDMEINIDDRLISCKGIIIDKQIKHSFSASNHMHFTMLIEPASTMAIKIKAHCIGELTKYYILDDFCVDEIRKACLLFIEDKSRKRYLKVVDTIYWGLKIKLDTRAKYDDRILDLLHFLNQCDCTEHSVNSFAGKVSLSPSRLAHLFKEQTGTPLKSYLVLHKLEKAYEYLLIGQKSITEASMLADFDSPSHLAFTNKTMTGMSLTKILKDSEFLKVSNFIIG